MAGPSTTGTLGLDISEFADKWHDVIREIATLEPEIKAANAQLKLMERQFRGAAGGAQVSAKQLEKQRKLVKALNLELKQLKTEEKAFRQETDKNEKSSNAASRALAGMKHVLSAFGIGLGVGGMVAFGKSILNFARETSDAAKTAGVLPESLQRIQAALSKKLSADDTTSALVSLNHALKEALSGSVDAQDKLAQLGITFADIKSKTPDEIILQLADNVKGAVDPVEALRAVTNLFGADLASRLTPSLIDGSAAIRKLADEASVASDSMIESAAAGSRALDRMGTNIKQRALSIVNDLRTIGKSLIATITGAPVDIPDSIPASPAIQHAMDIKLATRKAKAIGGASGGTAGTSAGNGNQLQAEKTSLALQSKIALEIAPEYVKQAEKLVFEYERLEVALTSARGLERERLQFQMAENVEARNSLYFAGKLRDSEVTLNKARGSAGTSFEAKRKVHLAEILDLNNQIAIARFKGDMQAVAALKVQRREEVINTIEGDRAHVMDLASLRIETAEMSAQSKGLKGIAEQARIIAQYDTEIANQMAVQNEEAVKLLRTQKALAQRDADAALHDVTPKDRRLAIKHERDQNRKARQQNERDIAVLRGRSGGLMSGNLNRGARGFGLRTGGLNDPSISNQAREARARIQLRNEGAQLQLAALKAVIEINKNIKADST